MLVGWMDLWGRMFLREGEINRTGWVVGDPVYDSGGFEQYRIG